MFRPRAPAVICGAAAAAMGWRAVPIAADAPAPDVRPFEATPTFAAPGKTPTWRAQPAAQPAGGPLGRYAVAAAAERVARSVVKVRAEVSTSSSVAPFFGMGGADELAVSHGSGFVIAGGRVMTCAHVVSPDPHAPSPSVKVTVTLPDGRALSGVVEASDARSDIAVVRVPGLDDALAVKFADSDAVRAGEFVVSVGAPLTLGNSVSFGVISCIQRDLAPATGEMDEAGLTYFQTDLAVNPGSSGGPLVSLDGDVVGMCVKKVIGDVEGIAFAVPANYARRVARELEVHGAVRRPFLGLVLITLNRPVFEEIQRDQAYAAPKWLKKEVAEGDKESAVGLLVHGVSRGPGQRAGIRPGDLVVAVDGEMTRSSSEFLRAVSFKVGVEVEVQLRKAATGELVTVRMKPEALMDD